MSNLNLDAAKRLLRDRGARRIFAKLLSPNDNSKNQVYLGGDFEVLQVLPSGEPVPSTTGSHGTPIFKAPLDFRWLDDDGRVYAAPHAQLILYPQYPEVRLSGFLRGAEWAPHEVMTTRAPGRVMLLGVASDGKITGLAADGGTQLAANLHSRKPSSNAGVLLDLGVPDGAAPDEAKRILLRRVCEISRKGWIEAWRLQPDGGRAPCVGGNCVGTTLESELGILANGRSEPDFLGWEVKASTVRKLNSPRLSTVTLMTPEPTGGFYKSHGVEAFVRKYGYPDKLGRQDRLNFGGVHKFGREHPTTKLTLLAMGFDADSDTIIRADGELALVDTAGAPAASWSFASLLSHWNRKHSQTAFVPAVLDRAPVSRYAYAAKLLLAQGTDFLAFLSAVADGVVYYDPGIKLEVSGTRARTKRRSQWRISGAGLGRLYRRSEWIESCETAHPQFRPSHHQRSPLSITEQAILP